MAERVVVGLTTTPTRQHLLLPTLQSLAAQSRRPDLVYLSLPKSSRSEAIGYDVDAARALIALVDLPVEIVEPADDLGPGTKVLGCMDLVDADDVLVLVDDDNVYLPFMIAELVGLVEGGERAASFYVYPHGGLRIGQGADGFAMRGVVLDALRPMRSVVLLDDALRLHDDYWISFMLARAGVSIYDANPMLAAHGVDLSHRRGHNVNALAAAQGAASRDVLSERANALLFELFDTPVGMRLRRARWLAARAPRRVGHRTRTGLRAMRRDAGDGALAGEDR